MNQSLLNGISITICKFGNFLENFIFANSVKRHICDVKIMRFGHDLLISVNDSDFTITRGFYFHVTSHMRSLAKIKHSQNFPNLQYTAVIQKDQNKIAYLVVRLSPQK